MWRWWSYSVNFYFRTNSSIQKRIIWRQRPLFPLKKEDPSKAPWWCNWSFPLGWRIEQRHRKRYFPHWGCFGVSVLPFDSGSNSAYLRDLPVGSRSSSGQSKWVRMILQEIGCTGWLWAVVCPMGLQWICSLHLDYCRQIGVGEVKPGIIKIWIDFPWVVF